MGKKAGMIKTKKGSKTQGDKVKTGADQEEVTVQQAPDSPEPEARLFTDWPKAAGNLSRKPYKRSRRCYRARVKSR